MFFCMTSFDSCQPGSMYRNCCWMRKPTTSRNISSTKEKKRRPVPGGHQCHLLFIDQSGADVSPDNNGRVIYSQQLGKLDMWFAYLLAVCDLYDQKSQFLSLADKGRRFLLSVQASVLKLCTTTFILAKTSH